MNEAIVKNDVVAAAVLSGNRNFEARIRPNIRANFLASPPLVVAYAIAGNVMRDLTTEALGKGSNGKDIYLKDIWPTSHEVAELVSLALDATSFRKNYGDIKTAPGELWQKISGFATGDVYGCHSRPTLRNHHSSMISSWKRARPRLAFERSASSGHFRRLDHDGRQRLPGPGSVREKSPAGQWLLEHGISRQDLQLIRFPSREPRSHDAGYFR